MGNSQAKQDKIIEEIATKETYVECPVLVDLDHGTIRHRHEEVNEADGTKKIGYFYHPKLNDFSEDAILSCGDNNRLKYVFQGPPKDAGKRLYYIYGTNKTDHDKGIHHDDDYRPQGKGYNWPQSYRKANNLYYDVIFVPPAEDEVVEVGHEFGEDDDMSSMSSGIIVDDKNPQGKDNIRLKLRAVETVGNVIERVSLQLLIPSTNIHLLWKKNQLSKSDMMVDLIMEGEEGEEKGDECPIVFNVLLRLT
jgi:hypothetical protein